jgi:flagellar biosynthesis protein FlhF
MNTRHFRAANTQLALEQVQRELGPEAIIVSVKQVPSGAAWQVWKDPEVEVIAMPAPGKVVASSPSSNTAPAHSRPAAAPAVKASTLPADNIEAILSHLALRVQNTSTPASATPVKAKPASASRGLEREQPAGPEIKPFVPGQPHKKTSVKPAADLEELVEEKLAPKTKVLPAATEEPALPAAVISVENQLEVQGLDKALVKKLSSTCLETLSPKALTEEARVRNHIRKQLEAYVRVHKHDFPAEDGLPGTKVICLVGPSGAGKTSISAKLTAYYTTVLHKKVAWICADTIRTGAIALARAYTEPFGIPLELAYSPEDLTQAVKKLAGADIILVDTPARNPRNNADVIEMGAFLTALPERITYLVVPATAKENDMNDMIAAFAPFNLRGLVFTKLDETGFYGSLFNLAWRSQIPMAYFSAGSGVMEDLFPAQVKQLVGMIFGEGLRHSGLLPH